MENHPPISTAAFTQYRLRFRERCDGLTDEHLRKRLQTEWRAAQPVKMARNVLAVARARTDKPDLVYYSAKNPLVERDSAEPIFCCGSDEAVITVFTAPALREQLARWVLAPISISMHALDRWRERIDEKADEWDIAAYWQVAKLLGPCGGDDDKRVGYGDREGGPNSPVLVYDPDLRRIVSTLVYSQWRATATSMPAEGATSKLDLSLVPPPPAAETESESFVQQIQQMLAASKKLAAIEKQLAVEKQRTARLTAALEESIRAVEAVAASLRPALSAVEAVAVGLRAATL